MTVKNKETGKSKTVDLNDFVKNFDMKRQPSVKAYLAKLPGEVLMDLFTEVGPLKQANSFDKILFKDVVALYNPFTNNIINLNTDSYKKDGVYISEGDKHQPSGNGKYLFSIRNQDWWKVNETIFDSHNWSQEIPQGIN